MAPLLKSKETESFELTSGSSFASPYTLATTQSQPIQAVGDFFKDKAEEEDEDDEDYDEEDEEDYDEEDEDYEDEDDEEE